MSHVSLLLQLHPCTTAITELTACQAVADGRMIAGATSEPQSKTQRPKSPDGKAVTKAAAKGAPQPDAAPISASAAVPSSLIVAARLLLSQVFFQLDFATHVRV